MSNSSSIAELKSRSIVCHIQNDRSENAIDTAIENVNTLYRKEGKLPKSVFIDFLNSYKVYRSTDFERAAVEFHQLLERCEHENEDQLRSFLLLHLGTLFSFLSDYRTSLQYFLQAEESQQYNDHGYQALLHVNISGIYSQILDYSSSAHHAAIGIEVLSHLKNDFLSVLAYLNFGHAMIHLKEFEDAEYWLYKSLSLAEETQYDRGVPYAELYTAVLEQKKGIMNKQNVFIALVLNLLNLKMIHKALRSAGYYLLNFYYLIKDMKKHYFYVKRLKMHLIINRIFRALFRCLNINEMPWNSWILESELNL